MVRPIGVLVGLGFVAALIFSLFGTLVGWVQDPPKETAQEWVKHHTPEKHVRFSFEGPFGKYDRQQLQRGYQVYKEVCAACHSMKLVAFRDLEGIGFSKAEVKALAKATDVPSINPETGEPGTRKALPSDYFPSPYANDVAARAANNNALPPDQSLLAKAREGGPHYLYNLLTGYQEQPAALLKKFPDAKTPDGLHYNPYFPNLNLAMAPPLTDNQVTYAPGNPPATMKQMAKDVSAFLVWAAEPKLEQRKRAGWAAVIFLIVMTGFIYSSYQGIWADKKAAKGGKGPQQGVKTGPGENLGESPQGQTAG